MQKHLGHMVRILAIVNIFIVDLYVHGRCQGQDAPARIVAFGDSLMAGYMLSRRMPFRRNSSAS